jgi:hypothetical protein
MRHEQPGRTETGIEVDPGARPRAAAVGVGRRAAALMDVHEILDRQAAEEWAAWRAAVKEKKQ